MHVPYPNEFPQDCIAALISIGRGGLDEIRARKSEVAAHAWNVQGYAQYVLLGNPELHGVAVPLEQLEELCAVYATVGGFTYDSGAGRDWRAFFKFFIENVLPIILPLILDEEVK